jgi:vancomycin aglycone glucosyltransferase
MKALVAGVGSRGDLQPLVALAVRLRDAGHEVRLAGSEAGLPLAAEAGIQLLSMGPDLGARIAADDDFRDRPLASLRKLVGIIRGTTDDQFAVLEPHHTWADVIVAGGMVPAAPVLAEHARIPLRLACYATQLLASGDHPTPLTPDLALPSWVNRLSWWLFVRGYSAVMQGGPNAHRERLGLPRTRRLHYKSFPPHALLVAADSRLCPPAEHAPDAIQTGPWVLARRAPIPPEAQAWLESGPAPVYVGFGSMPDSDPAATTRLIAEAVEAAGVRAFVSAGAAKLGGDLPSSCFSLGDCAHGDLFPALAGVVHHGGAGTTHAAALAGVPQLVVPHLMDQYGFGRRVAALGIGPPPLRRSRLTAAALADGLRALTTGEAFRQRAAEEGARMRAIDGLALAVRALEHDVAAGRRFVATL